VFRGVYFKDFFVQVIVFKRERNIMFFDKNKGRTEQNQSIDEDVIMQGRFGCLGTFRAG
jgi:hypothetical protein